MGEIPASKPILELNGEHLILTKLLESQDDERIAQYAHLLFDQARLLESGTLKDTAGFAKRLNALLARSL